MTTMSDTTAGSRHDGDAEPQDAGPRRAPVCSHRHRPVPAPVARGTRMALRLRAR